MDTISSTTESHALGDAMESVAMPDTPPAEQRAEKHVCPYCGLLGPRSEGPCARCTVEDSPQTRQATRARIGPWYVLQNRNPAAPGMKWSTLLMLVKKGQVTPRSVVRGPTTHQLWRLASQVKGLSREFGVCYSCGGTIDKTANQCPHCDRLQEPPPNPDVLLESREAPRRAAIEIEPSGNGGHSNGGPVIRPTTLESASVAIAPAKAAQSDAGILSAKELAAAFQLSFGENGGSIAAPSAPAAELQQPAQKPRRNRLGRVAMVLILLTLVGFGAVVCMTPPYQAKARELLSSGWDGVKQQFSTVGDSISNSSEVVPPPQPTAPAVSIVDEPAKKIVPAPAPIDRAEEKVAERKPEPPKETAAVSAPPTDPEMIRQLVRSLRSSAIDAEAAGDFARAVKQYESIRRYPREHWPSDLELRLSLAKERM